MATDRFDNWFKISFGNISQKVPDDIEENLFNKVYKEKFDEISGAVPPSAQENIFIQSYKNNFNSVDENLPEDLWVPMENTLSYTENRRRKRVVFYFSSAFLFFMTFLFFITSDNSENNSVINSKNNSVSESGQKALSQNAPALKSKINHASTAQNLDEQKKNSSINSTDNTVLNNASFHSGLYHKKDNLTTLPSKKIDHSDLPEKNILPLEKENNLLYPLPSIMPKIIVYSSEIKPFVIPSKNTADNIVVQKYRIGIFFNYNYIGAFNHYTYNSFRADELLWVNPNFGMTYGLTAEKVFSAKNAFAFDLAIHSEAGQKYKEYDEGRLVKKESKLNYAQLNLIYKKRNLSRLFRKNATFNWLIGSYFSLLKSSENINNGISLPDSQMLKKYDAGIIAGAEYEFQLNRNLILGTAFQSSFGLVNIFAGNAFMPSAFNRTFNNAHGLKVSVKYSFSSRNL